MAIEFSKLFKRDLDRLSNELSSYSNEEDLWIVRDDISNSSGNLALHLCGNLQHFIGSVLGKSGYERDRSFEFEGRVSLTDLQREIKETSSVVLNYLESVKEEKWMEKFLLQPLGYPMSTSEFIFHLYGHLNYHLGQINYHRRLIKS